MLDILRTASQQAVDAFASNLHTSTVGVVERVDLERMRVDVRPVINRAYEDGEHEEHAVLLDVPLMMPGCQQALISLPVAAGDSVTLIFAQSDIDTWSISDTSQPVPAATLRQFDSQDAIAIPGIYTAPRSLNRSSIRKYPHNPKDLVVSMNTGTGQECEVRLTQTGEVFINTGARVTVNAQDVAVNAQTVNVTAPQTNITGNVAITGNVQISGIMTLAGINMNTHKHIGVQPGSGTTGIPV
ncbi:Gp138 family membrane-puncturing spike protein [Pseudomonas sp. MS15a(2019)]|uniref:Gp138 family membrane-puncturing spike protein n=1 Tax=Pseudomonas sp. MS15a(2019) TaxID=2579938 RepID=UPI0015652653|nr:Gp138 family membrane-puncturing spike protein [Pseudomonas sp. MS15a(2019)]NRH40647.1 hypothetical protein [Pseudomonas sp. MS15a(2019)]